MAKGVAYVKSVYTAIALRHIRCIEACGAKFFCHRFAKDYGYAIIDIEVSYVQIQI